MKKAANLYLLNLIFSEHKERVSVSPKEIIVDVILTPIPKPSTPTEEVRLFGYILS